MNISQADALPINNGLTRNYFPNVNRFTLFAADVLAILFSWIIYGMLHDFQFSLIPERPYYVQSALHFFSCGIALFWLWGMKRHYTYRKPFWDELHDILYIVVLMALLEMAMLPVLKAHYSVSIWACAWVVTLIVLPIFRALAKKILNKLGMWQIPSIIIGDAANASEAYHAIAAEPSIGIAIKAFVSPAENIEVESVSNIPYIETEDYFLSLKEYPKVFIALEQNQSELREKWLRELTKHGVRDISIIPPLRGIPLYHTDISHFFSNEVMMLRVKNNLQRGSSRFIKRSFDIVASGLLLCLLSPLFLYIACKVKRDGGAATYGHERVGMHGKKFKCLKFRSMVTNSKEVLEELLATDPAAKAEWDREFKLKHDPRITPIGGLLRKTSLDELPQLWNVFKGEMSLVGPRPIIDQELERYQDDVDYYLMAKPGMSGLWQVSGRSDTDYATRVYLDSWYVKNWSLWYDIVILFKTVGVVLKKDGAY